MKGLGQGSSYLSWRQTASPLPELFKAQIAGPHSQSFLIQSVWVGPRICISAQLRRENTLRTTGLGCHSCLGD